ncbi:MAG: hypothetical protein IT165_06090 [Bryobacterales bacterium]|nr:hypothetical protein [Bryobacterales bacterium]
MEKQILQLLIPVIGLVSGLIATYVSLQNRALLAEVRREMAEMETRLFEKLNGKYVRSQECALREALVLERINALAEDRNRIAAGG